MPVTRELFTDADFQEAVDQKQRIRVFRGDHLIDSSTSIVRFTSETIITQSSVSDLTYHPRRECQFFEIRK
ncbi:hypothetical protein [Paenibacillus physcomitrellae]|uniref:Uncharacterized protein n=1 Tax=Paenibacillus physcomitrellae TaxID=1619311 RepID=A0ABQ1G3Y2_9BACL|nr:hypothetical protein [Paenibacillus physcomitrellae]GGA37048.1 hypothetical protein GCM10010917_22730 [Paenibacillus physcomitrellae]